MKNFLQLFSLLLIVSIFGACTSTNSLTYCPDFKKKNNAKKNFAINFKKKQDKKRKAIAKQLDNVEREIQLTKTVKPLEIISLNAMNKTNLPHQLALINEINFDRYLNEELSEKINDHFNIETATASLNQVIDNSNTSTLENLGLTKFIEMNATKPLSKKEIRKIERKAEKIERKLKKLSKKENTLHEKGTGTQKSQLVALLLAIFLGIIGVHRFYLGYTGIGIAQIFTFGGCGVWALIDLIRIITGDLKPADGSEYDPETAL